MKKDIDVKCYELTLTPNYVSDWTFNDALRELIQNGTDQEVLDKENKFQIIYNGKEKTLRLVNQKSVLKINTLLLGRSSKANNEDTVGQFGEGYKIAALVLQEGEYHPPGQGQAWSILHGTQREQQTASQPEAGMCLSDVRNIFPTSKETGTLRKGGA